MSKKPLGLDKYGVQKVMRTGDYFADSLGQFSLNIISGLVGQLTYFYTDKVGIAAGAIATMLLICKVIDAFTDIFMGNIVDHTAPGKEKYRPWILRMAIPAALVIISLFTVPKGWGETMQIGYLLITNVLLSAVIYTAICIPYSSILVVRTNSQEERGTMGIWRAASGYVSGMIIAVAVIPITNALGGNQSAWIKMGAVFGLFIALALIICYLKVKETAVGEGVQAEDIHDDEIPVPFGEALKSLFGNKYWVMILIMNFCANISYGISGASGTYYCKWIYGDDNLVAIQGAIGMIPTILGFVAVGPMSKKLGVTKTLRVSFLIGAIGRGLFIWIRNNNSPRQTVEARVVTKRMKVQGFGRSMAGSGTAMHSTGGSTDTRYFVTFELEKGERIELGVKGSEYGMLAEGDQGELTFQGTRYIGFERK